MKSLEGHLLVASHELVDPNFLKTVVFIIKHGDEGAFGVVINRPSNTRLKKVWSKLSSASCRRKDLLYVGGPCQGPLMTLHAFEAGSEMEIIAGLHFTADPERLNELIADPAVPAKFLVGYAGWGEGQLEGELETGSWLTLPAKPEHVFSTEANLWEQVMKEIQGASLVSALKIKHVPPDLRMN